METEALFRPLLQLRWCVSDGNHTRRTGTHVLNEEWDLLVVLDTCRVDALEAVADEYEFIDSIDTIWSLGSNSKEWMSQTFDGEYADEIADMAYITANPYSQAIFHEGDYPPSFPRPPAAWPDWDVVSADDFGLLDEVWRDETDDRLGVTPPEVVTDRTILDGRNRDEDRLLAHYM